MAISKRVKAFREKLEAGKTYNIDDALNLIKQISTVKFDESVDISLNLGIDSRKSDQLIRGSTVLPKGSGKKVRVAVFTQGPNVEKALAAGADLVGMNDLAELITKGEADFNIVIASPDAMSVVGKLGQILGPKGLMPNPKDGTVTPNVELAVKNAKAGQARYRADKNGIVHASVGKASFSVEDLKINIEALIGAVKRAKPASVKGIYMKKMTISSTMGPGIAVDLASING